MRSLCGLSTVSLKPGQVVNTRTANCDDFGGLRFSVGYRDDQSFDLFFGVALVEI